jgi:large subunit ribosomal protein L24
MIQSSQPRKQRLFRFTAPMHVRQHFVHSHIDKALIKKLGLSKKSVQICKGDTVKVMAGSKKGTTGKVTRVNLRTGRVDIDSLTRKNAKGKEITVGINASNVYITDLNLTDKYRANKLKVAVAKQEPKKPAQAKPKAEEEKKEDAGASTRATQAAMAEALQNKA